MNPRRRKCDQDRLALSQQVPSVNTNKRSFLSQPAVEVRTDYNDDDESAGSEADKKVVVRALNFAVTGKPFKKADLLRGLGLRGAKFMSVLESATKIIAEVYGLDLYECEPNKYLLSVPCKSKLRQEIQPESLITTDSIDKTKARTVFVGIALSIISFSHGRLTEDRLKSTFALLFPDMDSFDQHHKFFGNPSELLSEMVTNCYLSREIIKTSEQEVRVLTWGSRAEKEVDKEVIKNNLKLMLGGSLPSRLKEILK